MLPRRSLSRTSQHVQFKDAAFFSSSLSDQSTRATDNSNLDEQLPSRSLSSRDISLIVSSKDNSTSLEDVFYSPETSANESKTKDDITDELKKNSYQEVRVIENQEVVNDIEMKDETKTETKAGIISQQEQVVLSPRARRSYKSNINKYLLLYTYYTCIIKIFISIYLF